MRYFPPMSLYWSMVAANKHLSGKNLPKLSLLSVDTGTRYIGLSVSDTDFTSSSPLRTIRLDYFKTAEGCGKFMDNLIRCEGVGGLTVGYSAAALLSERENHEAQIMLFLDQLFESGYLRGFPFTLIDETGSTTAATDQLLLNPGVHSIYAYKLLLDMTEAWVTQERWMEKVHGKFLYSGPKFESREARMEDFGTWWNRTRWGE